MTHNLTYSAVDSSMLFLRRVTYNLERTPGTVTRSADLANRLPKISNLYLRYNLLEMQCIPDTGLRFQNSYQLCQVT